MKVELTYFKPNGKYYSSGSYETKLPGIGTENVPGMWQIWDEVLGFWTGKCLPDLIIGHSPFIVLVNVPSHPHNHPHLIGVYE